MLERHTYKVRLWVYVALLIIVVGAMYSLRRCGVYTFSDENEASGGDTIDVAIEYSPMSLYSYADTLGGFNYDFLREIARKHGVAVKFHPIVTLSTALDGLENGRYDLLLASMPMTAEYREKYGFSDAVYIDKQVLVQLRDSVTGNCRVKTQLDLAGDTVWVVASSPVASRIHNLSREIGDTIYVEFEPLYAAEQLLMMVAAGEIKQAVIGEQVAKSMAEEYPMIDISTNVSFSQFHSWVLRKDDTVLLDSINVWINKEKLPGGSYDELVARYRL